MQSIRALRLFVVDASDEAHDRAVAIVAELRDKRQVVGQGPEWTATYVDVDTSAALRICEEDLSAIDPRWPEVLDFAAVPPRPIDHPEPD